MQISSHLLCKSKLHLVATKIVNAKKTITACITKYTRVLCTKYFDYATKYCCKWLFLFSFLSFLKAEDSICLTLSRLTNLSQRVQHFVQVLPLEMLCQNILWSFHFRICYHFLHSLTPSHIYYYWAQTFSWLLGLNFHPVIKLSVSCWA